jgi:DNA replication protein DnaC
MLIQPTLDALNRLKLHGMALALSEQMTNTPAQQLAFEERIALLLEREVIHRENSRMGRLWKACQPKERGAVIEDIDYRGRGGLDRAQLASLASCEWIRQSQNLLIHGACGSGKTYLACALAHQACRAGLSAWYVRAPRLFEELSLCHADGTFRKRLAAIAKINLVIIDDFAISPIGPRERNDLLELLDDRVGSRASILASQLPIEHWHEYLNDPTLADAIMDRLIHCSHKIHLQGKESMRKRIGASKEAAKG